MRLTVHTDYALRSLMFLANSGGRLISAREIGEVYNISSQNLSKVAQSLADLGLIATVRGRGGGLRLAKAPEQIALGPMMRTQEQGSALVKCFPGGRQGCKIAPACRLGGILAEAQEAFYAVLDGYTEVPLVS
jgi:Rrf2 family nitric oxide-sensitive transcriptional repressor